MNKVRCPNCGRSFKRRGLRWHLAHCKGKHNHTEQVVVFPVVLEVSLEKLLAVATVRAPDGSHASR